MSPRKLLPSLSFLLLLVPGIGAANLGAFGSIRPATADLATGALKMGAPADAVKKALGEPVEIRPMKAPSGKAEVWVYVQEVSRRMEQMRAATADSVFYTTDVDGMVRRHVTPGQVTVHDVQFVTEETIEVLMFNNHYVTQQVSRAERKL